MEQSAYSISPNGELLMDAPNAHIVVDGFGETIFGQLLVAFKKVYKK